MPILAYTGLPRSGKSYGVTENVILPALKDKEIKSSDGSVRVLPGRTVVTNIPLNLEEIEATKDLTGRVIQFDVEDIKENPDWFDELPPGCVFVFDECWDLWPAGLKATDIPHSHKNFIAKHGHMVCEETNLTTEIVLVTQDLSQLCAFVKRLINETYRSTKLTAVGKPNSYRIDIYFGAMEGANPPVAKRIRQIFGKYEESVYKYYKSHTLSDHVGIEQKADDRANMLQAKSFKYGAAVCLIVCVVAIWYVYSFFQSGGKVNKKKHVPTEVSSTEKTSKFQKKTKESSTKSASSKDTPVKSDDPYISDAWRVVGIIKPEESNLPGYAYLASEWGNRTIPLSMCKQEPGSPDWTCLLGKEIVTQYSGVKPGFARASRNNGHIARR